jgi:hypothetical protein
MLVSPFRPKSRLEAENAVLRHQLIVLRRKLKGRAQITNSDRCFFYSAVPMVPVNPGGTHNHSSRDLGALAPGWLSLLLALEIPAPRRATADSDRAAFADTANEHRKFAVGCGAHSWRAAQAWVSSRTVECGQIHGQAAWSAKPSMVHFSA